MALLNCQNGCRAHIDTQTDEQRGDEFRCSECGHWTTWAPKGGADARDYAELARMTEMRTIQCPHCSANAFTVAVGALGANPSDVLECKCTYTAAVEPETHYRYAWRGGMQVREPVQMERVTTAPFTITVANLILQGKLLQVRPYPVDPERMIRASRG